MNLLRQRTDKNTDEKYAVKELYPVGAANNLRVPPENVESFAAALESYLAPPQPTGGGGKKKQKKQNSLGKILNSYIGYGSDLIDHFLFEADLNLLNLADNYASVLEVLQKCYNFLLDPTKRTFKGYITYNETQNAAGESIRQFLDYQPFNFSQLAEKSKILEYDRFSQSVDTFYGQIQTQKSEQKMIQAEKAALKKLENVKLDHHKRLENLQRSQEDNKSKGNSYKYFSLYFFMNMAVANINWGATSL